MDPPRGGRCHGVGGGSFENCTMDVWWGGKMGEFSTFFLTGLSSAKTKNKEPVLLDCCLLLLPEVFFLSLPPHHTIPHHPKKKKKLSTHSVSRP